MAAPLANRNKQRGARVLDILMAEARKDDWDRVKRGCSAMLNLWAEGDVAAANWCMDRMIGRAAPVIPDGLEDRAFSVTWSFGPAALEVQQNQALSSAPALPVGEAVPRSREEG